MLRIESYERAIENQSKDLRADGINPTLFWAYRESCKAENELVNFSEVIWDNEIECRLSLSEKATETFKTSGEAIMWCFKKIG